LNLKIKIIAVDGVLRNPSLLSNLSVHFPPQIIQVINAVKPADLQREELNDLLDMSSFAIGRKVTQTEVAVMISHQKCYALASQEGCDFLIVLEDDVEVTKDSRIVNLLEDLPESEVPTIWTLFKSRWSAWHIEGNETVASFPPPCAAAYVMNNGALRSALKEKSIGVADWPIWSFGVKFKLIDNAGFVLLDTPSYIESGRETRIFGSNILALMKRKKSSKLVSRKWPFIFRVLIPLKWRFYRIKSRILPVE
jgi:hypothetical protein